MQATEYEVKQDDFVVVGGRADQTDVLSDKTISFWSEVGHTFLKNKLALFGLCVLAIVTLMALFVPVFSHFSFSDQTKKFQYGTKCDALVWDG